MDKDKPGGGRDNYPGRGRSGGRGGGFSAFIPIIISLVSRKPRLLIVLVIIAVLVWVFGGLGDMRSSGAHGDFGMGMEMKESVYDEAAVYEPLADNKKNPLPERISLEAYAPARLNQGRQGSCVGWASSYAARTILHARATGINPNRMPFSPSYVYNQIALRGCQGSYMLNAMETLHRDGSLPMAVFGYDESTCRKSPDQSMRQQASQYRITGYNRLSVDHDKYAVNMLAVKQNLAQGAPVVIGAQVGGSFMDGMRGKRTWIPTASDYSMNGFGGHAMCVIGYDDYHYNGEGAFQVMNSWGPEWGEDGIAWIRYKDFEVFVKEAWGLFPMGSADREPTSAMNVSFGLVNTGTGEYLPLAQNGVNSFTTTEPVSPGDRFKVEITNSVECYVYIFGQETDETSYVLFPYTPKHSPYCGITGTRLFPRDYSLVPDEVGDRDYIAAVFSKRPIDYDRVNQIITRAPGTNYADKLQNGLGSAGLRNIAFQAGEQIAFRVGEMETTDLVAVCIGMDKQ